MTAQVAGKKPFLSTMSRKRHELVGCLDNMLSRIARETEEIRDLEQQLTDNQILANNAFQKDLEGIIAGLKKYLRAVRDQAHKAHKDCQKLQKENEALKRQLKDSRENLSQVETEAKATQTYQKELLIHMGALDAQLKDKAALRESQSRIRAYEAELESQLLEQHMQAGQLREDVHTLHRLSMVRQTALQLEWKEWNQHTSAQGQLTSDREQDTWAQGQLTSDRGQDTWAQGQLTSDRGQDTSAQGQLTSDREQDTSAQGQLTSDREQDTSAQGQLTSDRGQDTSAQGQLTSDRGQDTWAQEQLTSDREQVVEDLQKQLTSLQNERHALQDHIQSLQSLLEEARSSLLSPLKVTPHLDELIASVVSEQPRFRIWGVGDKLGCSLEALQKEVLQLVFLLTDRQQKSKILQDPQQDSPSTKLKRDTEVQRLREELGRLEEELEKANRQQEDVSLQLEQSQEERGWLLAALEGHCSQARLAERESQQHIRSLTKLLRNIQIDMASADRTSALQLTAAAEQLRSLRCPAHTIDMNSQTYIQ